MMTFKIYGILLSAASIAYAAPTHAKPAPGKVTITDLEEDAASEKSGKFIIDVTGKRVRLVGPRFYQKPRSLGYQDQATFVTDFAQDDDGHQ